jgi:hypothetical protein
MKTFDNAAKTRVFSARASRSRRACLGDQRLRGDGRYAVLATIKTVARVALNSLPAFISIHGRERASFESARFGTYIGR